MSPIFHRKGATHPLDGILRSDRRTGRPALGLTEALPPVDRFLLTPLAPPFFLEVDPTNSLQLVQRRNFNRRLSILCGLSGIGCAVAVAILVPAYLGPAFIQAAAFVAVPIAAIGAFLIVTGQYGPTSVRIIGVSPDSNIYLVDRHGKQMLASVTAPPNACALRVHPLRLEANKGPNWLGYGVVLTIGEPPAGLVLIAAFELESAARAYVRDLPEWLRSLDRGSGDPVRGRSPSTHIIGFTVTRQASRLSKGRCPRCNYDLTSIEFRPCPECGKQQRESPRE